MPRTQPTSRLPFPSAPSSASRPEAANHTFRLGPPMPGTPAVAVQTCNLAFSIAAGVTGAYRSCPRRDCRKGCSAGHEHRCGAEFPPVAWDMMMAMHAFLLLIPCEMAAERNALWDAELEASAGAARVADNGAAEDGIAGDDDAEAADPFAADAESDPFACDKS